MRYGKISEAIWSDERFQALSDRSKLLYIYLLSCENCNSIGIFRIGYGTMEDGFGDDREQIKKGMQELEECGILGYKNGWLWFNKYLRWNEPTSPNHAKQCAAYINDCVKRQAPMEAVWGFLSTAYAILGRMGGKQDGSEQRSYYDYFKKNLDMAQLTAFLGGEDNVMTCLSGKPVPGSERQAVPKHSASTFQQAETEPDGTSASEALQKLYPSTSNTNNNNNKDKDNNKTRQDNDNKSIGLSCNNGRINYQISLTCKDGILYAVKPETIDAARRLYPRLDINKASQEIVRDTEIDRIIRPDPNQVDAFFLNAMRIRGGAR